MCEDSRQLVPKVHPLTRNMEADDPLEIFATPVFGDPLVMLECLIGEYAGMGWNAEQILQLFRDPEYPALHGLLEAYGEATIRRHIRDLLDRTGIFSCEGTVLDEPEPDHDDQLVELGLPCRVEGK
jgi:hypothetical protein